MTVALSENTDTEKRINLGLHYVFSYLLKTIILSVSTYLHKNKPVVVILDPKTPYLESPL